MDESPSDHSRQRAGCLSWKFHYSSHRKPPFGVYTGCRCWEVADRSNGRCYGRYGARLRTCFSQTRPRGLSDETFGLIYGRSQVAFFLAEHAARGEGAGRWSASRREGVKGRLGSSLAIGCQEVEPGVRVQLYSNFMIVYRGIINGTISTQGEKG